jgi:hypothetical protein
MLICPLFRSKLRLMPPLKLPPGTAGKGKEKKKTNRYPLLPPPASFTGRQGGDRVSPPPPWTDPPSPVLLPLRGHLPLISAAVDRFAAAAAAPPPPASPSHLRPHLASPPPGVPRLVHLRRSLLRLRREKFRLRRSMATPQPTVISELSFVLCTLPRSNTMHAYFKYV